MTMPTDVAAAVARLEQYNLGQYDDVTNPFGLSGIGGMDANWGRHSLDMALVANWLAGAVDGVDDGAAAAAQSVIDAAGEVALAVLAKGQAEAARDASVIAKGQAEAAAAVAVAAAYSMEPAELAGLPATLGLVMTGPAALPPGIFSRTSPGTYYDAAGVLRTAASGQPRFDHNPITGALRGLRFEPGATNLLLHSEAADNAAWTKVAATVSANAVAAPDGGTTADKLVEDTSSATGHYDAQIASGLTPGGNYTFSRYVRAGERTVVMLRMQQSTNFVNGTFNLTTGTASVTSGGAWTGASLSIQPLTRGWYRCSVTATVVGSTAVSCLTLLVSGGFDTYTGDGASGAYVWGAQLETGLTPSSYIATAGSTVPRAADTASSTDLAWYNHLEGTLRVAAQVSTFTGVTPILQLDDGTANNRITIDCSGWSVRLVVVTGGVTQVSATLGSITANMRFVVAVRFKADDFAGSLNGAAVVTDTSGTLPTVTTLQLGVSSVLIERVTGFARTVNNNTLQLLSAG